MTGFQNAKMMLPFLPALFQQHKSKENKDYGQRQWETISR
jgi:hypothetical protein